MHWDKSMLTHAHLNFEATSKMVLRLTCTSLSYPSINTVLIKALKRGIQFRLLLLDSYCPSQMDKELTGLRMGSSLLMASTKHCTSHLPIDTTQGYLQ